MNAAYFEKGNYVMNVKLERERENLTEKKLHNECHINILNEKLKKTHLMCFKKGKCKSRLLNTDKKKQVSVSWLN